MGKLTFPGGITSPPAGEILGNVGTLSQPHSFSEIFRQNDTLYSYITNRSDGTVTRLTFPPCNNSNFPSSTSYNPPPILYDQPGVYNIRLLVDEGLPTQVGLCKPIVIMSPPTLNLGNDTTICSGNTMTLNAGPGFTNYLWSTGEITQTIQVTSTGLYWVSVAKWGCQVSDTINVSVVPGPVVNLGPDTTICQGQSIMFDAGACTTCTYQWADLTTGQTNIGSGQTYTTGQDGTYMVTKTNTSGCYSRDTVTLTVNPNSGVSISITSTAITVCQGTLVQFTAFPVNGGTSPFFQWKVNGINSGTDSPSFSYIPLNNDQVNCELTTSLRGCITNNPALSNAITMVVNPNLTVRISISPDANPVCQGTPVHCTAIPLNGGTAPSYQWKLNGNNAGSNSADFSFVPLNNDQVSCELTSSLTGCVLNNPAMSNVINMVVNPIFTVSITISPDANPVCKGTSVQFTAIPVNPGSAPSYQWKVNNGNTGTSNPLFNYIPQNGDQVYCTLLSDLLCAINNPANSNVITMTVKPLPYVAMLTCTDTMTIVNAQPFRLKRGIPPGGYYSGPGVDSLTAFFTPSSAGLGIKGIHYTYSSQNTCSNSKSFNIHVQSAPVFSCGQTLQDIRDGKTYPTVQLGTQCWMRTNLNYGSSIAGTLSQSDNCQVEKYCYADDASNCTVYGGLYQWDELMQYQTTVPLQGLCPPGWHIPSQGEWMVLFTFY